MSATLLITGVSIGVNTGYLIDYTSGTLFNWFNATEEKYQLFVLDYYQDGELYTFNAHPVECTGKTLQ